MGTTTQLRAALRSVFAGRRGQRALLTALTGIALGTLTARSAMSQTSWPASSTIAGAKLLAAQAGSGLPNDWKVKFDNNPNRLGHTDHKNKIVWISAASLDAYAKYTHSADQLPGIVAVTLLHEIHHCNFPSDVNVCSHIELEVGIAAKNCAMVSTVIPGSPAMANLCAFHASHREKFNKPNGWRRDDWEAADCPDPFPTVPPCAACEEN